MKYRVWPVGEGYTEDRNGVDYEVDSDSAQCAVQQYAKRWYALEEVGDRNYEGVKELEPAEVFVRYEEGNVIRWRMRVLIEYDVAPLPDPVPSRSAPP